jgi:CBS domain-containing protein
MKARDIMTSHVISVGPDTTVDAIAATLSANNISAVPVIDIYCCLVGIVSEGDLIRRSEIQTAPARSWWLDLFKPAEALAAEFVKSHAVKAKDIMTRHVRTVSPNVTLQETAELLEQHGIKRVPVVEEGLVIGIVSRANLIQALAAVRRRDLDVDRSDEALRDGLRKSLQKAKWSKSPVNIIVRNGAVDLWGVVGSRSEKQATRVAAEAMPGVSVVRDHLRVAPGTLAQLSDTVDTSFGRN